MSPAPVAEIRFRVSMFHNIPARDAVAAVNGRVNLRPENLVSTHPSCE